MAMNVGAGPAGRIAPQMNVTPLVDVVLVLLIIFMVVTPLLTKSFGLTVPKKPDDTEEVPAPSDNQPLTLTLAADGSVRLNSDVLAEAEIGARLRSVLATRSDGVLFFDAEDTADYGAAVKLMDTARGAGAATIAVVPLKH
jgi:biopolymer transport protein ExbD/biopolymer transport protein TolR